MNIFENQDDLFLENFSYWERRNLYLELMEKFIDRKMPGKQFTTEFFKMLRADRDRTYTCEELRFKIKDLDLTKLENFESLIVSLFTSCDVFQPDPALRKHYEISEEELRKCVQKVFLEIQNNYP